MVQKLRLMQASIRLLVINELNKVINSIAPSIREIDTVAADTGYLNEKTDGHNGDGGNPSSRKQNDVLIQYTLATNATQ